MKKRILVTAAGTATAWHICKVVQEHFKGKFEAHVCDVNPPELVAASCACDMYHRVPYISSPHYYSHMLDLLDKNQIDVIIPLIDQDLFIFSADNRDLADRGILSTAPVLETVRQFSDKRALAEVLSANGLPTPAVIPAGATQADKEYVVKPAIGCGTKDFRIIKGKDLKFLKLPYGEYIIQEKCNGERTEITAEVFHTRESTMIFCRERVETKAGVCTKMRPTAVPDIERYIYTLAGLAAFPPAFCLQFLHHDGAWNLIDCNLRPGAGTGLSAAAGFQLVRALLLHILGENPPDGLFHVDQAVKSVVRVYKEVVMR